MQMLCIKVLSLKSVFWSEDAIYLNLLQIYGNCEAIEIHISWHVYLSFSFILH